MVQLQVAIGVELEIGRKTAQSTLDSLISRVALHVVFQIEMFNQLNMGQTDVRRVID